MEKITVLIYTITASSQFLSSPLELKQKQAQICRNDICPALQAATSTREQQLFQVANNTKNYLQSSCRIIFSILDLGSRPAALG